MFDKRVQTDILTHSQSALNILAFLPPYGRLKSYSHKAVDQKGIIMKAFSPAYSLLKGHDNKLFEMIFNLESYFTLFFIFSYFI